MNFVNVIYRHTLADSFSGGVQATFEWYMVASGEQESRSHEMGHHKCSAPTRRFSPDEGLGFPGESSCVPHDQTRKGPTPISGAINHTRHQARASSSVRP